MTESMVERELKFDVDQDFAVPDIAPLAPEGGYVETATEQLRSDYFDTADHALLTARITLRRRTGTTDTGWHLKIPHPPFREEIRTELTADSTVPAELLTLLLGVVRDRQLSQVASVRTERRATRLLGADGLLLAEIADDLVHASAAGEAATASSWREVEVEVTENGLELLEVLAEKLRAAGARPAASGSKLGRALSGSTPKAATTPDSETPSEVTEQGRDGKANKDQAKKDQAKKNSAKKGKVKKTKAKADQRAATPSAGRVVADYLVQQQQAVLVGDLALRRAQDAVIHKTRVATRRLRSTLRVYGVLFQADRAASLDGELRWYAELLGNVRDRQVQRLRLDAMLDDLDDILQLGPVRARVHTELDHEQREHWRNLQHDLSGPRYLALLADIDGFVTDPPWTAAADEPAEVLQRLLARAERKVSRLLDEANAAEDIDLLHGARKAAKRARYAAEAAQPVLGAAAAGVHADRYQRLQDLLGEHQDSLVTAELLRRLGSQSASIPGENGFAFGILYEREARAAATARAEARRVARTYR